MPISIVLVLFAIIIAGALYLYQQLSRRLQDLKEFQSSDKSYVLLNQNFQSINERLDKSSESMNARLDNAARVILSVQRELGIVQERFKGFEEFSDLLHPKLRGNIGEQILSDMLAQIFSAEHYELQHKFKGGETVDAIIRTRAGIVPIDSKFPLENFRQFTRAQTDELRTSTAKEFAKAVKKHIDDISKKYILPEEGTVTFAVMYVPSENVYYHILTDEENSMLEYAKSKGVLMVSPHGFYGLIRVIMMGMERNRLQEQAQKIWDILKGVQQESVRFNDTIGVLARHVTNAKGAMDNVQTHYAKLSGKLEQVNLLGTETAPQEKVDYA